MATELQEGDRSLRQGGDILTVRVSPELHQAVKRRAKRDERTVSQTMRLLLRQYVEEDLEQGA